MLRATGVERHDEPYTWARIGEFLPGAFAGALADDFPADVLRESRSSAAHYHLRDCTLIDEGRPTALVAALPASWRRLVDLLLSGDYRDFVSGLTGVDLDDCRLKVRPCEYGPSDYMTAHTDKPDRVVTQILYLSRDWAEEWGGQLDILTRPDDDDPAAVAARVWPRFNSSVVFVRCDHSYHAVRPVGPDARGPRRSVLAQFVSQVG